MPKPVDSLPEWASTANFPASVYPATYPWGDPHPNAGDPTPWSSQPTKDSAGLAALAAQGHVPLEGTHAAHYNEFLNIASRWVQWVEDGNDAGAADAHIVETDADGTIVQLAAQFGNSAAAGATLILGETAGGDRALSVSEISGSDVAAAFAGTGNAAEVVRIGVSGAMPGLIVTSTYAGSTPGAGDAIRAYGGGDGSGVEGYADSDGYGVAGFGGSAGGAGVFGSGLAANSPGGRFEGDASQATSYGVEGRANHPDARGVWGLSDNLGSTTGVGVLGQGQDDATGVRGLAQDGYGVVAESDTTTPARSAMRIVPQDTEPASGAEGDVFVHNLLGMGVYSVAAWRRAWLSTGGLAQGNQTNQGGSIGAVGPGSWTTVATASLAEPTVPRKSGVNVLLRATFKYGYNASGGASPPETLGAYRIYDNTASAEARASKPLPAIVVDNAITGGGHQHASTHIYAVPAAGARTFFLQLQKANGSLPNINFSDCSLEILGTF